MQDKSITEYEEKMALLELFRQYKAAAPEDLPGMEPYRQLEADELQKLIDFQTYKVFAGPRRDLQNVANRMGWFSTDQGGILGIDSRFLDNLSNEGVLVQFYAFLKYLNTHPEAGKPTAN